MSDAGTNIEDDSSWLWLQDGHWTVESAVSRFHIVDLVERERSKEEENVREREALMLANSLEQFSGY